MLALYAHPFSSYSQKVLIALWEYELPFEYRMLAADPTHLRELKVRWPFGQFPVLIDGDAAVAESSIIIEHLTLHHAPDHPTRLVPRDPAAALEVRELDRVFDQHVMTPMQRVVGEALRGGDRLAEVRAAAATALDIAYDWLNRGLEGRTWAAGNGFTLADCAAGPSLFYADWVHAIDNIRFPYLRAYRSRLLGRPSFARAVEEARPFRHYFPLGAPARD